MSEGYLEKLQELVAQRSTDYRQMGQLVSLAHMTPYRLECEIVGLNHELAQVKKKLAVACYLLNDADRAASKLKCWEFPPNLKIGIRQFLGKDITP